MNKTAWFTKYTWNNTFWTSWSWPPPSAYCGGDGHNSLIKKVFINTLGYGKERVECPVVTRRGQCDVSHPPLLHQLRMLCNLMIHLNIISFTKYYNAKCTVTLKNWREKLCDATQRYVFRPLVAQKAWLSSNPSQSIGRPCDQRAEDTTPRALFSCIPTPCIFHQLKKNQKCT